MEQVETEKSRRNHEGGDHRALMGFDLAALHQRPASQEQAIAVALRQALSVGRNGVSIGRTYKATGAAGAARARAGSLLEITATTKNKSAANRKGIAISRSNSKPANAGPKTRASDPHDWKVPITSPRLESLPAVEVRPIIEG